MTDVPWHPSVWRALKCSAFKIDRNCNLMVYYTISFVVSLFWYFWGITFQLFILHCLAKNHGRGFSIRNAHMFQIVNKIRCRISLLYSILFPTGTVSCRFFVWKSCWKSWSLWRIKLTTLRYLNFQLFNFCEKKRKSWKSWKRPSGAPLHIWSKLYDFPIGFVPPLFWGCVLPHLRLPKGGCCSITDDLSCSWNVNNWQFW